MADELRPSEVARRLGTSTRTVQRWIDQGRLPARRVGGRWRVASDAFDAFSSRADPTSPAIRPFHTVFVANRGEIAARIRRTGDRLGLRTVVPATDGSHALDLLDIEAVVAAAQAAGADAVHPGFGFLAENAAFAEAVLAAGIVWVGPPPAAIRAMGDKAAARRLAAKLGVPTTAGYDEADQTDAALLAAGARIGAPILVKPAAGGGGKGMRTVRDLDRLPDELGAARREARSAFGDERLILERLVDGARHVEVQVLFDAHGHGVHLGERDCSLQRRHQKVLEEAAAPRLAADLRARLGAMAVELAAAVGYVGAGTCEFLVDERGAATFLEMNTRLQVEHPVTEAVTGRDLVADQLRIAAGEPLGVEQGDVAVTGHAVEVRLYAEDAEDGFLPATGRLEHLRWPTGEGIRVDTGIAPGDEVTSRFDPMLAKIVAHGPDRATALDRLTAALDATVILGVTTNLRFLRWLVREPVVRDGRARTDTLDRIWPPDGWADRTTLPDRDWSAAAALLAGATGGSPWTGGWRLNAPPRLTVTDGTTRRSVEPRSDPAVIAVRVDDVVHLDAAGRSVAMTLAPPPDVDRAARAAAAHAPGGGPIDLIAPMPGRIIAVHAAVGQPLEAGSPVVTLEAMKMEHVVSTPRDGRLAEIAVAVGAQVDRGMRLATVEP